MPAMLSEVVAVFVTVTASPALLVFTSWVANVRLAGASLATVPVPLRETLCGLPDALSVTDSFPVRVPICVGLKLMLIVQLAPAARLEPQVWVWLKSPVVAMPAMLSVDVPWLVRATDFAALAEPIRSVAKVRPAGDNVAFGAEITAGLFNASLCGPRTTGPKRNRWRSSLLGELLCSASVVGPCRGSRPTGVVPAVSATIS